MNRGVAAAMILLVSLLSGAGALQAQQRVGVQVGIGPTVGIGGDKGVGFHLTAGAGFVLPAAPVGLRVEGLYQRVPEGGDDHEYGGALLSAEVNLPVPAAQPYLVGGGALIWHREHHGDHTHEGHTDFGFNVGVGARFALAGLSAFLEARFHQLLNGEDQAQGYGHTGDRFVPITLGIRF
jgi:hypothetical protein